jgi:integrase
MPTSRCAMSCGARCAGQGSRRSGFHDLHHIAGTLMHEAGVPLKRAQEILGHASEHTTLAIYTHAMRRPRDDSAAKIAALAGLSDLGNNRLCRTRRIRAK